MKLTKFVGCVAVATMALGAFADAANVLIMFSTPGPDKYADGATVIDGERYALVWSVDGNFDGIKTDGTAVDKNDLVIYIAPLAKGGCCPLTMFEIDSQSPNAKRDGVYGVYLLDTRTTQGAISKVGENGLPEVVNGAISTQDYTAAAAMASVTKKETAAQEWGETEIAAEPTKPLKITAFKVENALVSISVEGMLPGVRYNVMTGATPDKLENYALETPATATDTATIVLPKDKASYFQVVREPLKK